MIISKEFTPKLFSLLKDGIPAAQIRKDIVAGIIVGIVALPLAIAFAIASGVSPEKGLITAIVAGFIISILGGSRVQIGGPTGAFIVIVYGITQNYGVEGLTIATFIAGFLILAMGLLKFGTLLKYIPHPLIVGFTSGIAIIIFSSQINDLLGLGIAKVPSPFLEKWYVYFNSLTSINPYAIGIGIITILLSFFFPRITTKVPGSLIAIVLATVAVQVLQLPVETIETKFGAIPNEIPKPHFFTLTFSQIMGLIQPAFAIALLGGIESLLSAVVADGMIGSKHRSNIELVAQGLANIGSAMVGGIPATGAIARTATNIKNGGRTPVAGITHAITLLLIMLIAAPYAKLIPLSCLAGVLVVVAYNMGEWHNFKSVFKGNFYDRLVLITVFFLTVIFDLIIAIEIGMVLSAFLFIKRMSDITNVKQALETDRDEELPVIDLPKGVMLYEITGALFFGATQSFQDILRQTHSKPKAIILNFRNVTLIDATAAYRLGDIVKSFSSEGTRVFLTGYSSNIENELKNDKILSFATVNSDIQFCLDEAKKTIKTTKIN